MYASVNTDRAVGITVVVDIVLDGCAKYIGAPNTSTYYLIPPKVQIFSTFIVQYYNVRIQIHRRSVVIMRSRRPCI